MAALINLELTWLILTLSKNCYNHHHPSLCQKVYTAIIIIVIIHIPALI